MIALFSTAAIFVSACSADDGSDECTPERAQQVRQEAQERQGLPFHPGVKYTTVCEAPTWVVVGDYVDARDRGEVFRATPYDEAEDRGTLYVTTNYNPRDSTRQKLKLWLDNLKFLPSNRRVEQRNTDVIAHCGHDVLQVGDPAATAEPRPAGAGNGLRTKIYNVLCGTDYRP